MRQIVNGHVLYEPNDFDNEDGDDPSSTARMVCEGGLGICMNCGDGEIGLEEPCPYSSDPDDCEEE